MFIRNKLLPVLVLIACTGALVAVDAPQYDPLPEQVSNNAVAAMRSRGELLLFSFMGLGPKKTWDAVTNNAYILNTETGKWAQARSVPGPAGRLAADASSHDQRVPACFEREPADAPAPFAARRKNLSLSLNLPVEFMLIETRDVETLA